MNTQRLHQLRFQQLAMLVELERTGSMRQTAAALHLSAPAISKSLLEIERILDATLFERFTSGVQPTLSGKIAAKGAAFLLKELHHLQDEIKAASHAETIIRVGAPPFIAQRYLPGIMAGLLEYQPAVRLKLHEDRAIPLMQALLEGELDALVCSYDSDDTTTSHSTLRYDHLFDVRLCIIAPKGREDLLSADAHQLIHERWVFPTRHTVIRGAIEKFFKRAQLVTPEPLMEWTSAVTGLNLVSAGIGLSIVPEVILKNPSIDSETEVLEIATRDVGMSVGLISVLNSQNFRAALLRSLFDLYPELLIRVKASPP